MKINRYFIFIFAPLFVQIPTELFGINGVFLQRIPLFFENGFPYIDFCVLIGVFSYITTLLKKNSRITIIDVICGLSLILSFSYLFFSTSKSANQIAGLFLANAAICFTAVGAKFVPNSKNLIFLEKYLFWQTVFCLTLALLLILHATGILRYAQSFIVYIDRFEGEGLRIRWEAVRLVERVSISTSVTWAIYKFTRSGNYLFLCVPIVFGIEQLVLSSRGGVALVLIAAIIPYLFFPSKEKSKKSSRNPILFLVAFFAIFGLALGIFLSDTGQALIYSLTEWSDEESIRARMTRAALQLYSSSPVSGLGYFDIFSTPEWQPFILPNMLLPLHNMFLHQLVYFGPIGLALFCMPIILATYATMKLFRQLRNRQKNDHLSILVGVSFSALISGVYMLYFQTLDRVGYSYFWFFVGLIFACYDQQKTKTQR